MILRKIFFLIFLGTFTFGNTQTNGKAYYKKQSSNNFKDSDTSKKSPFSSVNEIIGEMEFILTFNDSLASYEELTKLNIDDSPHKLAKVFSGYQGPYYFNLNTKQVIRIRGKYLISKPLTSYEWELSKEKLVINDLNCYKATTEIEVEGRSGIIKREITAWYTPDINISAGPDGFTGLPGLIIQLEQQNIITTLTRIDFSDTNTTVELPIKGEKLTEEEFKALMKDLVENREKYYGKD